MTGSSALALALVAVAPLSARAEPLSLADCLRLAEAAPSPVVVAERQRAIAAAHLQAGGAGLLPRLSVGANYTRNSPLAGSPGVGTFVSLNGINEYSALVSV